MWKVNCKTSDNKHSVEVSAVIEGTHGDISWGWHDDVRKVIVLSVHDLYQSRPVSEAIIELAVKEAQVIRDERNSSPIQVDISAELKMKEEWRERLKIASSPVKGVITIKNLDDLMK